MATLESIREADERQREAEERNPLLKLKLGELVREMQIIVAKDPNVLTSKSRVEAIGADHGLENYERYISIVKELERREKEYSSYKPPRRF